MGNTPSKAPPHGGEPSPNSNYPTSTASQHGANYDRRVNRRSSIQALSGPGTGSKSTAADPSASRESATGHPIPHRQQQPVQQWLQNRNITETSRPEQYHKQQQQRDSRRGYKESIDRREYTRDIPARPKTPPSSSAHQPAPAPAPSHSHPLSPEPSKAVRVPSANHGHGHGHHEQYPSIEPSGPTLSAYYGASAHLSRPPRLPLPIGDAETAPGSPIMAPSSSQGIAPVLIDKAEMDLDIHDRGESVLGDEEDGGDELEGGMGEGMGVGMGDGTGMGVGDGGVGLSKAVPTTIEWRGGGEKVYVTGTFVNWERKFRLHKSETEEGVQSTTLQLRQGTHHLKFIVDGIMSTSDQLPTAVDFTNHLVNYIEVSPEEVQRSRRSSDLHPDHRGSDEDLQQQREAAPEEEIPLGDFRNIIPPFLLDIETEGEEGEEGEGGARYTQAANVIGDAPAPPILPLLLGKSILNSATPMKDDSSVLNVPNHTVLNHLATSSIKNGVLATSVTTRYKTKCVTTIVYKPTGNVSG
ncbi:hypothetical protein AJ79_07565 [Helicocarpus griseus UAMH5409]|uniref:Association with the SNF1 complex (ASC) domain-containing protein n=1 Tax=Helicocarpus griseus UAMH5409 TaxID=1447875 RepID=A0A2B7X0U7_9EURO|nr:hypothetical protein AJ79_07565 [Helicocarpus griseus UAMH5409]